MKRCPSCKRVFEDDRLTVCIDDGSVLINDGVVSSGREFPTPQGYSGLGGKATWSASQDDIPELKHYLTATTKPERRTWPWAVGIGAVLLIIAVAIVLASVILRR